MSQRLIVATTAVVFVGSLLFVPRIAGVRDGDGVWSTPSQHSYYNVVAQAQECDWWPVWMTADLDSRSVNLTDVDPSEYQFDPDEGPVLFNDDRIYWPIVWLVQCLALLLAAGSWVAISRADRRRRDRGD